MEDTQNTPGGAILRPMLALAEQRKRDLALIAELDAERDAANEKRSRTLHLEATRTASDHPARPAPKRKTVEPECEPENTPAGAILGPMLRKRSSKG